MCWIKCVVGRNHEHANGFPLIYRYFWDFGGAWHGLCKWVDAAPIAAMTDSSDFDPARRYVRIINQRADGMVEFEFAVGEPQLFVEMVMPRAEFDQFCRAQQVQPTQGALPDAASGSSEHEWDWNLRLARERHFRDEP